MFKLVTISILIIVSSLLIYSCNSNKIFEKHMDVDEMQWAKSDVKSFEVEILDLEARYTISIAIRYVEGCPYQGIPVNLSWRDMDGQGFSQTKSVMIRDDEGDYIGGVLGNIYDLTDVLIEDHTFEKKGQYTFELSHFSDYDPMLLLEEIGLIIEKEEGVVYHNEK